MINFKKRRNKMDISHAKKYLIEIFKPEYSNYIKNNLAGDFAVVLAKKIIKKEERNGKRI